ncbi:MAG: hypothetical protein ACKOPS_06690, partial [Cyanobium sp.]
MTRHGVSVLRTLVVRPETIGSAHLSQAPFRRSDSERTGSYDDPATETFASGTMLTLRSSSPFDLFDRLEQQLSQQLQSAERVPTAEVHETPEA